MMKVTDKESFEGGLELLLTKWKPFLNERTKNAETGKVTILTKDYVVHIEV